MAGMSDFVEKRKGAWDDLSTILGRAGARNKVNRLSREDLQAVGPLYRRTAADLAFARLRNADPSLVALLK